MEGTAEGGALPQDARLTEGDAAVHAPGPLLLPGSLGNGEVELLPVLHPLRCLPQGGVTADILYKSSSFTHLVCPPLLLCVGIECLDLRLFPAHTPALPLGDGLDHAQIVPGHDLLEAGDIGLKGR